MSSPQFPAPELPRRRKKPKGKRKSSKLGWRWQNPLPALADWGRSIEFDRPDVRIWLVWLVLAVGAGGLLVRLFYLQVIAASSLQKRAQSQQIVSVRPLVPRRPIVARNGELMAIDRPSYTLQVHPKLFKQNNTAVSPAIVAAKLAPILDRSADSLSTLFATKPTGIKLGQGLGKDIKDRIEELKIDGIEIISGDLDYTRLYPQGEMAAEILGYVDINQDAQAGVEYSQTSILEREISKYTVTRTARGEILPDRVTADFLHADRLQLKLTIDLRLQQAARRALKDKMQEWNAVRGTAVVMDAQTGAIRSLVVEPTYDPNRYSKYSVARFKNWAVADLYEPGSTFKPINVAIALEEKAITPESKFNDTGLLTIGIHQIRNSDKKAKGIVSISQILEHSSNIGMVEMMQKLKPEVYYSWMQRIGLGQRTGIDLPFEPRGEIKSRKQFVSTPIEPATTAFGQGFALTPIQLVTLTASLANGGKLVTPHVVEGLFDRQGTRHDRATRPEPVQIFSPSTSESVLKMMESVVAQGTGMKSQISGYRIAGKTGTAQKAATNGGYRKDAKITSFVGILPVNRDRRYVVFVAVDEPKGKEAYGGTIAAPVVKSIMESLISIEGIPPSK
jgi:cell division protein FtsI (penicillin-binding protein 3)